MRAPSKALRASARRLGVAAAIVLGLCALGGCGGASPTSVAVFPVAGSQVASPQTQIAFRGASSAQIGKLTVTGSRSGVHSGRIEGDSDGHGASFLPSKPFSAGETVSVRTSLPVVGAQKGTFHFTVATPAAAVADIPVPVAPRVAGDVSQFHSRPDLQPPTVTISHADSSGQSGDVFVGNQVGPDRDGPMIVDAQGTLVWFHPVPAGDQATDFRVQQYHGQPVLTWWQGYLGNGVGVGHDVIYDSSYRQLATVQAANGLSADLHEFQLTSTSTALITAYYPVYWNTSSVHGGHAHAPVLDGVVQEIDIKTGLVLFQWDSLDHVPVSDSEVPAPTVASAPYDYFHVNSAQRDGDGALVISARNTWAAYKVSHTTGQVMWALGGKRSSFHLGSGSSFAFQHDVRVSGGDAGVTLFDDGAGPPAVHKQSRGIALRLNSSAKTATLTSQYTHSPALLAQYEGNVQPLAHGDVMVGWGGQPYFTEYNAAGRVVFDGRFVDANTSYRAYRFAWTGTPRTPPKIAVTPGAGTDTAYVSWNGATEVAKWRVLGGPSTSTVRSATLAAKSGFETKISVPAQAYMAVQALNAAGHVIGTSATVHVS